MKYLSTLIIILFAFSVVNAQDDKVIIDYLKRDTVFHIQSVITYEDGREQTTLSIPYDSTQFAQIIFDLADEQARALRQLAHQEKEINRGFQTYNSMLKDFSGQSYREQQKLKIEEQFKGSFVLIAIDSVGRTRTRLRVDDNKLVNNDDKVFCRFNIRNDTEIVLRGGILSREIVLVIRADGSYRGENENVKYIMRR